MKNGKLVVAFDTDDTLLIPNIAQQKTIRKLNQLGRSQEYIEPAGYKHTVNINAYRWFQENNCYMIIWSGTGKDWAKKWSDEFGLNPDEIREKGEGEDIDICVDDSVVDLAKVNIRVKRINNSISRKEWNKEKR